MFPKAVKNQTPTFRKSRKLVRYLGQCQDLESWSLCHKNCTYYVDAFSRIKYSKSWIYHDLVEEKLTLGLDLILNATRKKLWDQINILLDRLMSKGGRGGVIFTKKLEDIIFLDFQTIFSSIELFLWMQGSTKAFLLILLKISWDIANICIDFFFYPWKLFSRIIKYFIHFLSVYELLSVFYINGT